MNVTFMKITVLSFLFLLLSFVLSEVIPRRLNGTLIDKIHERLFVISGVIFFGCFMFNLLFMLFRGPVQLVKEWITFWKEIDFIQTFLEIFSMKYIVLIYEAIILILKGMVLLTYLFFILSIFTIPFVILGTIKGFFDDGYLFALRNKSYEIFRFGRWEHFEPFEQTASEWFYFMLFFSLAYAFGYFLLRITTSFISFENDFGGSFIYSNGWMLSLFFLCDGVIVLIVSGIKQKFRKF